MRKGRRLDRIERMKSVEREYQVAIVARDTLIAALQSDPSTLTNEDLEYADFLALRKNLASTYLIRLFAEFERAVEIGEARKFLCIFFGKLPEDW
jgi:hypothetical protein